MWKYNSLLTAVHVVPALAVFFFLVSRLDVISRHLSAPLTARACGLQPPEGELESELKDVFTPSVTLCSITERKA